MFRPRFLLLGAVLLITAAPLLAEDESRWLISRSQLASTDIKIVWQHNLPFSGPESLDRLLVFGNRLCSLSSNNYLSCLNRNDGNVMSSSMVAPAGLPLAGVESYKGGLMTTVGAKLVEINADLGTQQLATNLTCNITCPVVRNDSFYYIACNDNRIHAIRVKDKVEVFQVAAENGSPITAVLAAADFVVFATEPGNITCIASDRPLKLWQFDVPAAVAGTLIRDANSLYFACRDTNIYRLELSLGHLVWKYQTSAILDTTPQLGGKAVYQYVPDVGLIAIDKEKGKSLLWQVPDGVGLLTESGDKSFVVTRAGLLVKMDNTKGKQLYSVDFGRAVKYATNLSDSKMYIADANGRLACIEPAK